MTGNYIFNFTSGGLLTSRDNWVYNFSKSVLEMNVKKLILNYSTSLSKWQKGMVSESDLRSMAKSEISWSRGLINRVRRGQAIEFETSDLIEVQYRPYVSTYGYKNKGLIESPSQTGRMFPDASENLAIVVTGTSSGSFGVLPISKVFDLHLLTGDAYSLYAFEDEIDSSEDPGVLSFDLGSKDPTIAITDAALALFRSKLKMPAISKQDIFYYVYGVLSSPEFRDNFEMDVKKMGPRVPLLANFDSFAKIGKELFNLQLDYRNAPIPDFVKVEISDKSLDRTLLYKVDKMRYGKLVNGGVDRSVLHFNEYIKIVGIPESVQTYVINGRSALDWSIDQFKFSKDKDTGITNDPNLFSADEEFILNTILRIIEVSKRTVDLLESLPQFEFVN